MFCVGLVICGAPTAVVGYSRSDHKWILREADERVTFPEEESSLHDCPWTEGDWSKGWVLMSWCTTGPEAQGRIKAQVLNDTRTGIEAIRAHFGLEPPR